MKPNLLYELRVLNGEQRGASSAVRPGAIGTPVPARAKLPFWISSASGPLRPISPRSTRHARSSSSARTGCPAS